MEVYLDNSATTKPYSEAVEEMANVMTSLYGNPSALHLMGKNAEDKLNKCRDILSSSIGCKASEFYFTSGGTESDNIAIIGYCMANRREGRRIICTKTEHAAVLESFAYLETQGFDVVYIDVDDNGFPDMDMIKRSINDDTILMSFMLVNNENGAIFPIDEISALCDHKSCALHVDAVQAYGKINIDVKKQKIDMLSLSSHKIHGPNGIGGLYVREKLKINPIVFGGGQEKGLRSGTENIAAAAGFAKAAQLKLAKMDEDAKKMSELKNKLKNTLISEIENTVVNTPENSVCSVLNISFPRIKSEVLLHVLESKGIYVSTGSACNSKKNKHSYVLKAMGLKSEVIEGAIRFSLSSFTTEEEIVYVCDVLKKEIPLLRKIMR